MDRDREREMCEDKQEIKQNEAIVELQNKIIKNVFGMVIREGETYTYRGGILMLQHCSVSHISHFREVNINTSADDGNNYQSNIKISTYHSN